MTRLLPLLAAAGTALAAQTTTVSLVIPLDNPATLYGSVVNVEPEATTYAVACPEGSDDLQCRVLNTQTVIQGPSTVSIHYSFAGDDQNGYFTEDLACKVNFKEDIATCNIQIAQGKKGGSTSTTSVETTQSGLSKVMRPVTVTAGVDKLEGTPTSSAGTEKIPTSAAPASSTPTTAAMTHSEVSKATDSTGSAMASASASSSPETVSGASNMGLKEFKGIVVVGMTALVAAVALL